MERLAACLDQLINQKLLIQNESLLLDMGCADGRVNILLSYLVKHSVGIELDEWTLDEHTSLRKELEKYLANQSLLFPPNNITLFHGDSMDESVHERIQKQINIGFEDFDLFYTYLTMQDEFAGLIARKAKKGALFMVYGLDKVMPKYDGLQCLTGDKPLEGILALYRKSMSG